MESEPLLPLFSLFPFFFKPSKAHSYTILSLPSILILLLSILFFSLRQHSYLPCPAMSSPLLAEATRIAREFDYPAAQVQRGVAEYIRQSNEGLAQENTTLSQIPTFVTAVPNGTEKVP